MWKYLPDSPGYWWVFGPDEPTVVLVEETPVGDSYYYSIWLVGNPKPLDLDLVFGYWLKVERPTLPKEPLLQEGAS